MSNKSRALIRMRDVGFALLSGDTYGQKLGRIQLQKFIYLLDVLSPLYYQLAPKESHITYKRGPFDSAIQDAVNCMVFRELVVMENIRRLGENAIACDYYLSEAGNTWVKRLCEYPAFNTRWQAAEAIGYHTDKYGWDRLVSLVYAEPTFAFTRSLGFGHQLDSSNGLKNTASCILKMIANILRGSDFEYSPDPSIIIDFFFRYLDEYARDEELMQRVVMQ